VATFPPAFAGGTGYYVNDKELYARDSASGVVRWRHRHTEGFGTPPLVAGSHVYVVTRDGRVVALARATGRKVWQSYLRGSTSDTYGSWAGIAAAGDTMVVSYGGRVTAYRRGRDTPGVNDPDKPPRTGIELSATRRRTWYRRPVVLSGRFDDSYAASRVEIQADPWPYGRYRRLRRVKVEYGSFQLKVRPARNTRYRAVYNGTHPVSMSKRVRIFSDLRPSLRVAARGKRRVLVRLRISGPPSARLRRARYFVYYFRSRARTGRRIGSLKMRGSRTRVKARKVFRTPVLRRSTLFLVCRRERRDDGFGQYFSWQKRCGRRRLR
jgi:PQQ-like domain